MCSYLCIMNYKTKGFAHEVKDIDEKKNIVKVAFACFDNKDSVGDIIHRGAFTKTIAENGPKGTQRILHFKNHSPWHVTGVLQELYEEGKYLIGVSRITSTTLGKDTMIEYREKVIREHSIGYSVVKQEPEENDAGEVIARHLYELKLYEGSSLSAWGANFDTPTLDVKQLDDRMKRLDDLLKVGDFSDERFSAIEKALNELKEVTQALKEGFEPILQKITQPTDEPPKLDDVLAAIRAA